MRLVLAALFALAGASAASAQVVQDRYGPPRRQATPAASQTLAMASLGGGSYDGRLLGWAGKATPMAHPVQPADLARPAEVATRGAAPFTPSFAPQPPRQPARAAVEPPRAPMSERPVRVATRPGAPFTPSFDPPPRSQPMPAPVAPRAAALPTEAAAQPAPARRAYALAGGPPEEQAPEAPATPPRVGATPRFYSLHREYGRKPDAIPPQAAAPRYVLIGPPDAPDAKAAADRDDDSDASSSHGQF